MLQEQINEHRIFLADVPDPANEACEAHVSNWRAGRWLRGLPIVKGTPATSIWSFSEIGTVLNGEQTAYPLDAPATYAHCESRLVNFAVSTSRQAIGHSLKRPDGLSRLRKVSIELLGRLDCLVDKDLSQAVDLEVRQLASPHADKQRAHDLMRCQRPVAVGRGDLDRRPLSRCHLCEEQTDIGRLGDLEVARGEHVEREVDDVQHVGARQDLQLEAGRDQSRLVSSLLGGLGLPGVERQGSHGAGGCVGVKAVAGSKCEGRGTACDKLPCAEDCQAFVQGVICSRRPRGT